MTDVTIFAPSQTAVIYDSDVEIPVYIGGDVGPTGAQGATGPQGPTGATGAPGANGKSVLNGTVDPTPAVGVDGDFYINTTSDAIFGPKTAGAWGPGTSLIGPQGPQGATGADSTVPGPQGPAGPRGYSVLNGSGAPAGGTGVDGDFYIDTAADSIYGPKTAGAWGSPTSLVGPAGPQGDPGPQGPQGLPGSGSTSDTPFGPAWDGVTNVSPSQNAVYDEMILKAKLAGGNSFTGNQGVAGNVTLTGSGVLQAVAVSSSGNVSASGTITAQSNVTAAGSVTGTLGVTAANGNLISQANGAGVNANVWLRNNSGVNQGLLYWSAADDLIRLSRYNAAGNAVEGEIYISSVGATVVGTLGATGDISTGAGVLSVKSVSSEVVIRGNGTEGGQVILGYKDQTAITQGGNSTWNIDVGAANELRLYRLNDVGAAYIALSFDEAGAGATFNGSTVWINTDKLLLQHIAGHGYIRTQTGNLSLGGGGNNQLVLTAAGGVTVADTLGVGGVLTMSHPTSPTIIMGPGPTARISANNNTLVLRAEAHHWERESGGATQADLSPTGLFTANEFQSLSHITTLGINYIKGTGPTQWWWDTDTRTFAIHVNGNTAYFMRGGINDPQWAALPNGKWPMQLNLETGAFDTGAGIAAAGNIYAQTDRRCYQQASPSYGAGAEIWMATIAPAAGDGNNGDIWLQYA